MSNVSTGQICVFLFSFTFHASISIGFMARIKICGNFKLHWKIISLLCISLGNAEVCCFCWFRTISLRHVFYRLTILTCVMHLTKSEYHRASVCKLHYAFNVLFPILQTWATCYFSIMQSAIFGLFSSLYVSCWSFDYQVLKTWIAYLHHPRISRS